MSPKQTVAPVASSTSVFKSDIFKGRVLFCTGGGSGICKSMVEAIMRHGADAVIVGRQLARLTQAAAELSKATGRTCIPAQADVRQPQQLKDAVSTALDKFGKIDFVICGAAGNFLAPISNLSENAFRTVVEIDTLGTFNTIKATLPHLRVTHGAYIHVSATLQSRGTPYQAHMSAAKAAIDATSRVLAVEEGPHGIRSNVVAPGAIGNTAGMDRLTARSSSGEVEAISWEQMIPLGRAGDMSDIANAAVWLFSDAAAYVTGQIIVVDGGWEDLRTQALPYPQSVLDPASMKAKILGKL